MQRLPSNLASFKTSNDPNKTALQISKFKTNFITNQSIIPLQNITSFRLLLAQSIKHTPKENLHLIPRNQNIIGQEFGKAGRRTRWQVLITIRGGIVMELEGETTGATGKGAIPSAIFLFISFNFESRKTAINFNHYKW